MSEQFSKAIAYVMRDIKEGVEAAMAAGLEVAMPDYVHFEFPYAGLKVIVDIPFEVEGSWLVHPESEVDNVPMGMDYEPSV